MKNLFYSSLIMATAFVVGCSPETNLKLSKKAESIVPSTSNSIEDPTKKPEDKNPGDKDPSNPSDPKDPKDPKDPSNPGDGGGSKDEVLSDRSEIFTQRASTKSGQVDLLWVIDNSKSMKDEQEALGKNFSSFINQFLAKDVDFKMAIITTDPRKGLSGKMIGDSSKLTSLAAKQDKNAFISNFNQMVKVGIDGFYSEQGLKTSSDFIDLYGASFLRKDAYFAVVYISDEQDDSGVNIKNYIQKLQALKANKGMVKAYSIVAENTGADETLGTRYIKVSDATGGIVRDIQEDFSDTLLSMGEHIVNLVDSFALNEAPYQDAIEVLVNNVKVTTGFSFNPAQKTLKFNKGSVPSDGSKIEVRYKVKVEPTI